MWLECVVDHDYEILNEFPYPIRRKGSTRILTQSLNKSKNLLEVKLNRKTWYIHRIIAEQFIPNPNGLTRVKHLNGNNTDNHLENLAWSGFNNQTSQRYPAPLLVEQPQALLPEEQSFDYYTDITPESEAFTDEFEWFD